TVGATMAAVVVQIQDQFGNNISNSGTNISLTLNRGGTLNGTTSVNTVANGSATFSALSIATAGGGRTLSATATGLTGATSVAFTVNAANTTTALSSLLNPSIFGQSVTFTATVTVNSPGSGMPTGTVTFKDGAATLGTGTLNGSGQTTFSTSGLAVGSHSITAVYAGDGNFNT